MKRIVLTGAGGGLGRALVEQLAVEKPRILLIDIDALHTEECARIICEAGGEAIVRIGDVSEPALMQEAAETMQRRFGGVDLLVNNAGVAAAGAVGELPLADWEWLLRINLFGVIYGCHAFAPMFKAQRQGAILNVASAAALIPLPHMGAYGVSKAGVLHLSETLAAEMRPHGVSVSALCPTFFQTRLMQHFRSPTEAERKLTEWVFSNAKMSASTVARLALDGVAAKRLVIVPQLEGKLLWRLRRLAPQLLARVTGWGQLQEIGRSAFR